MSLFGQLKVRDSRGLPLHLPLHRDWFGNDSRQVTTGDRLSQKYLPIPDNFLNYFFILLDFGLN